MGGGGGKRRKRKLLNVGKIPAKPSQKQKYKMIENVEQTATLSVAYTFLSIFSKTQPTTKKKSICLH